GVAVAVGSGSVNVAADVTVAVGSGSVNVAAGVAVAVGSGSVNDGSGSVNVAADVTVAVGSGSVSDGNGSVNVAVGVAVVAAGDDARHVGDRRRARAAVWHRHVGAARGKADGRGIDVVTAAARSVRAAARLADPPRLSDLGLRDRAGRDGVRTRSARGPREH